MCNYLIFNYLRRKLKILPPQLRRGKRLEISELPLLCSFTADTNRTVNILITLVAQANNVKKCISLTNNHLNKKS